MSKSRFVAYYRVSTAKQGISGLGLEAQRKAVADYLGADGKLVGEFTEVESGRRGDRPELSKALATARTYRVPLIVANVSRLTRSAAFLSRLLEAGVDVRFCDLPTIEGATGRFMLQQMVSVAELEAGMISERTKKALAEAKRRGKRLGGFRGYRIDEAGRQASVAVRSARATARAADLTPLVAEIRSEGIASVSGIAKQLTIRSVPTPRGGSRWSACQVQHLLQRMEAPASRARPGPG